MLKLQQLSKYDLFILLRNHTQDIAIWGLQCKVTVTNFSVTRHKMTFIVLMVA